MISIKQVVPWGRSFEEYCRMFAPSEADLRKRIVGCADGPASFNAELTARGGQVVSCDPLYRFTTAEIREQIRVTFDQVIEQTIVPDDKYQIRATVSRWIADQNIQAIVTTGGTGLTGRDITPEAVQPLFDKEIEGVGEPVVPSGQRQAPGQAVVAAVQQAETRVFRPQPAGEMLGQIRQRSLVCRRPGITGFERQFVLAELHPLASGQEQEADGKENPDRKVHRSSLREPTVTVADSGIHARRRDRRGPVEAHEKSPQPFNTTAGLYWWARLGSN